MDIMVTNPSGMESALLIEYNSPVRRGSGTAGDSVINPGWAKALLYLRIMRLKYYHKAPLGPLQLVRLIVSIS